MKILLLTQWFQPEPFFKGLPFAKALIKRGHEVQVLTGFPNYPGGKIYPGYKIRPWQREHIEGVSILRVPLYPSHDTSPIKRSANYISFSIASIAGALFGVRIPEVIWAYNLVSLAPAVFILRTLYNCPIILDVQDLWPESIMSSRIIKNTRWNRYALPLCDRIYQAMDIIIAQSHGMGKRLRERGVASDHIQVCYNWTEELNQDHHTLDHYLAQKFSFEESFNVLFAGTMGFVQRLDIVLDAAQILKSLGSKARIIFVGDGVDSARLLLKAQRMKLDNVTFFPRQPRQEMGRLMSLAHVGLVHLQRDPLFQITIPSKIQAYMRAGLPILVAIEGDAKDMVEQAHAGVSCKPEDPIALATTITYLAGLPRDQLHQMGMQGQKFYEQEMSFEAGVDRIISCFHRSIANRKYCYSGKRIPKDKCGA
jgi:glycosyltransferase involved in cell wall biosynthesis